MEPHPARARRAVPAAARRGMLPRQIPDEQVHEVFAALRSHRDRALVAFWVSTGARASELLGATSGRRRPGTAADHRDPQGVAGAAAAARLTGCVRVAAAVSGADARPGPGRPDDPLWWTLRRPFRQLAYHAAHRMFTRASAALGANWSLHDLRHTAAYRMARDPEMPLTDVILSFRVSQGCDLRCPVVDSVADETPRPDRDCFTSSDRYLIELRRTAGRRARGRAGDGAGRSHRRAACCGRGRR